MAPTSDVVERRPRRCGMAALPLDRTLKALRASRGLTLEDVARSASLKAKEE